MHKNIQPCTEAQLTYKESIDLEYKTPMDLDDEEPVCQAERMISFSAPIRQPLPQYGDTILSLYYHYFGPQSSQDTKGVRGRSTVVNPAVCHTNCTGYMFALDHVYEQYFDGGGQQHWIEVGWAEVSWQANNRYIFEFK